MIKSVALLAMVLAGASVSGGAAPVGTSSPPVGEAKAVPDNALRLAALLNPAEKTLEVAMRAFDTGVDAALKKSPDDAAVFDRNPGLLEAVMDAERPLMRKHLLEVIPGHQRRYAEFYARKFTPEEIDQLIAFYSGPTGQKVIAALYAGVDLGKLTDKLDSKGNLALTGKDIQDVHAAAVSRVPDLLDADDWKAVFMFSATPVHSKLVGIGPEFNQLVAELENEPDPAFDARIEAVVQQAVKTYMAKKTNHGH
jgi:hypothetical protein